MVIVMVLQQGYSPSQVHRFAALAETATWTFLAIGMALKYSGITDKIIPIAGSIHGFSFLCFLLITAALWINNSWSWPWGIAGILMSTVPWAAYPFALLAQRSGKLAGSWRFNGQQVPISIAQHTLALFFRYPIRSVLCTVAALALVFGILLYLGPPVHIETFIRG